MPFTMPCPRCGTVGFVRTEHVFKGGAAHTRFYCGKCNQAWTETESTERQAPNEDDRDRSR
jgi:transposase-like protein